MSRAFNKLCHAERTSTCLSSMPCRCCPSIDETRSCSHPVHIQSPLPNRERRCRCQAVTTVREPISSLGKESDQWRVSSSQCWELKSRSFPDTLNNLVLGRVFCFWCFCVKACRNLVATRNHVACSSSEPERAEHWNALNKLCHAERTNICPSSMFCPCCQLMGHSSTNPVHFDHQYWRKTHMQVFVICKARKTPSFAKGQFNE